jgi:photosystem II stability/assembly factor-like uncharacterized protein
MPTKVSKSDYFDGDMGTVWVQPGGSNTQEFPVLCANMDAVDAPQGDTATRMCRGADGRFYTVHRAQGLPGEVTFTIETWLPKNRTYLQMQIERNCPMPVYLHHQHCGRPDTFLNYDRGKLLANGLITNSSEGAQVRGMAEAGDGPADMATESFDISAEPMPRQYWPLIITNRSNIAEDEALRDIWFREDARCGGPCGPLQDACKRGNIVADAASGVAADIWHTLNGWQSGAAIAPPAPFAADEDVASVVDVAIDRDTVRKIIARGTTNGNQCEVAYADYDIPTATWSAWTTVVVGGAVGEFAVHGGALFALDAQHIWICTDQGNVFFSNDASLSWTDQAAPLPATGAEALYCVRFFDYNYGVCVGGTTAASSVFLSTTDGGAHWALGTGPASKLLTGCDLALENRPWVTDEDGGLHFSDDFGLNWTTRDLGTKAPSTLGDVHFTDEFSGACCGSYNDTDDYAAVYRTFDGGYHWEAYVHDTPFDSALAYFGLNSVWVCDRNHVFAVGEVVNSLGLILELSAKGSV